jgi:methyl-accepting chemotaxis protein
LKTKTVSLRTQFLTRISIILLVIALVSGVVQIYFINNQVAENIESKSAIVSQSIEQGMAETELASQSIEHQIDLRLESYAIRIAEYLGDKSLDNITDSELRKIRDELKLTGITLLAPNGDDIVGVKSTEPSEIGFSFKKIGYDYGYEAMKLLLEGKTVTEGTTYSNEDIYVIPISQSGSHDDKPIFFKYAYYNKPGSNYVISPYLESNEIYQFTNEVGPESWIETVKKENEFINEVAVLDPKVFEDPELETKLFPPLKKVVYGEYNYKDSKDKKILISMMKQKATANEAYIEKYDNEKVYKMFIPTEEGKVVYVALDYGALSGPIYRHSMILIISSLLSLLVLFLLTARFFNIIYEKISSLKSQIQQLSKGDLTAKSTINDGTELRVLSESVNTMVENLNKLVTDTQEQASKTQKLSILLEAEASQSVEKLYAVSTEATMKARDQLFEITTFLDEVADVLEEYKENEAVLSVIDKVEQMRDVANERTSIATDITITLSDLLNSLHNQSSDLSEISNTLLDQMSKFKL